MTKEGDMSLLFVCAECGNEMAISNPVTATVPCDCGGTMRASTIRSGSNLWRSAREPAPTNPFDEQTSLMGCALASSQPRKTIKDDLCSYKAVTCPKCGCVFVTKAEKILKCRGCGYATKFRGAGKWKVIFRDFPTHELAHRYTKKLKQRRGEKERAERSPPDKEKDDFERGTA